MVRHVVKDTFLVIETREKFLDEVSYPILDIGRGR